jgi:hypothetical protein
MEYVPNYKLPDFSQAPDVDCDLLEVIPTAGGIGLIRYRDPKTGRTWSVPNVPYNQQREVRARVLDFYASEQENRALRFTRDGYQSSAEQANLQAKRMRGQAAQLRAEAVQIRGAQ